MSTFYPTDFTPEVLADVAAERGRQHEKWGPQHHLDGTGPAVEVLRHTDINLDLRTGYELQAIFRAKTYRVFGSSPYPSEFGTWRDILLEEMFEAMAEEDLQKLRTELIQVAAVAVAWVEDIDSRG